MNLLSHDSIVKQCSDPTNHDINRKLCQSYSTFSASNNQSGSFSADPTPSVDYTFLTDKDFVTSTAIGSPTSATDEANCMKNCSDSASCSAYKFNTGVKTCFLLSATGDGTTTASPGMNIGTKTTPPTPQKKGVWNDWADTTTGGTETACVSGQKTQNRTCTIPGT